MQLHDAGHDFVVSAIRFILFWIIVVFLLIYSIVIKGDK